MYACLLRHHSRNSCGSAFSRKFVRFLVSQFPWVNGQTGWTWWMLTYIAFSGDWITSGRHKHTYRHQVLANRIHKVRDEGGFSVSISVLLISWNVAWFHCSALRVEEQGNCRKDDGWPFIELAVLLKRGFMVCGFLQRIAILLLMHMYYVALFDQKCDTSLEWIK